MCVGGGGGRSNSVGRATCSGLYRLAFEFSGSQIPHHPEQLSLLKNEYSGSSPRVRQPGPGVEPTPPSAEGKNVYSYSFTPPVRLYGNLKLGLFPLPELCSINKIKCQVNQTLYLDFKSPFELPLFYS